MKDPKYLDPEKFPEQKRDEVKRYNEKVRAFKEEKARVLKHNIAKAFTLI